MQRMSAEPDNVWGFCVCCWCWVWSGSPPCSCSCSCYIGGHILRSPPTSQFHILTITTMSTIIIFTKIILTNQAAAAGCDPTLQLQLPPWMSFIEGTSLGHHHHHAYNMITSSTHCFSLLLLLHRGHILGSLSLIWLKSLLCTSTFIGHGHNCSNIFCISLEKYQSILSPSLPCPYHNHNHHYIYIYIYIRPNLHVSF